MLQNYFEEFGHKCQLHLNNPFSKFEANKNRYQLWFMRNSIISSKLILLRTKPRSYNALCIEILAQLQNYPYTLHPFSNITFYFDIIWMITVFVLLIIVPINLFYYKQIGHHYEHQDPKYVQMMLNVICVVDCARRFFTGYLKKHHNRHEIVLDIRQISIHYIKTYFFIDLLSSLSPFVELGFLGSPKSYLVIQLLSFLKFFRLGSMLKIVQYALRLFRSICDDTFNTVINSILRLAFIVHWVACLALLPTIAQRTFQNTSMGYQYWNDAFVKMSIPNKYISCLYRSASVLTGTGYHFTERSYPFLTVGDMLYTIFTAILGHILTTIMIAKLSLEVHNVRGSTAAYEAMLNEVSHYTKHHHLIQKSTQNKIKTYYRYKYNDSYFEESAILGSIPIVLREQILIHYAKFVLENVSVFQKLPTSVVAKVVSYLGNEIVMSGDVVYHCGDKGNVIFFIGCGTVAMFTRNGREINHLEDGAFFGRILNQTNDYFTTCVAIETCELFKLRSKLLYQLMIYCPDMVQQMDVTTTERFEMSALVEERFRRLLNKEVLKLDMV